MKQGFAGLKRLFVYIKPYRVNFYTAIILAVTSVIANALTPFIWGLIITEVGKNVLDMANGVAGAAINYTYVIQILIIVAIVSVIYQITSYGSNVMITNVIQDGTHDLRNDIDRKINRLPVSYFDRNTYGNILSRITNDVDTISNAMQQGFLQIIISILGIGTALLMMALISIPMMIIAGLIIPATILVSRILVKRSQPYFKKQQNTLGEMNGYIQEDYSGFNIVKLFNREQAALAEFKEINHRMAKVSFKALFTSGLIMPISGLITHLAYMGVAVLGGYFVIVGVITLGNLQAFCQYIWQINQPVSQITQLTSALQSAGAAISRVFEILDETEEPAEDTVMRLPEEFHGNVSFENVSFGYNPETPLIKDLNFEVKSGQTVAIVGPTGAGKTTLINLLMRFYDVDGGAIKIDGISTMDMKREDVRSMFGMVLQDAWLYNATISDNIRFGKLDAQEYEIVDAAKSANVHHFIKTLPDGYEMMLNEEASNVSQGQKQLLTIARAIISDPKILILDEATSSVDTRLELLIQKAMKRVMEGRTSFVIAHRLSTIRDADLILVMNHGEIIEQGTHDTLLAQGGFYEQLYNSQFAE